MKKIATFITAILLLATATALSAQANNDAIKKLSHSLRSHKNIELSFTYHLSTDAKPSEKPKEGKAYIQDNAYKLILEDQHTICDGTTRWQYILEDEEVMVGNATDDDNPFKILDKYEKDSTGVKAILNQKNELIELEIDIDEGLTATLNISKMKFDQDFPESFFKFDKKAYPNVEIIDMR